MNLTSGADEDPFLNVLKTAGGWYTENSSNSDTTEEGALYSTFVDGNHYPTSLTTGGVCPSGPCPPHTFTQVSAYPFTSVNSTFPAGNFVLLWTGTQNTATAGTLRVGLGASISSCPSTGRCIVTYTGNSKIRVTILTTDPNNIGNYINNVALVYSPDSTSGHVGANESQFINAGCMTVVSPGCFNPAFLNIVMPFKTFRMMDWGATLSNQNVNWSDRSLPTWAFWNENEINDATTGNSNGYPVEVMIAAANATRSNLWINTPCMATQTYAQNEANLIAATLNSSLKVHHEYCNEVWNSGALNTTINNYMVAGGEVAYPVAPNPWSSVTTYLTGQQVTGSNSVVYTSLSNSNLNHNPTTDGGIHWQNAGFSCPGTAFSNFSYLFSYGILQAVLDGNIYKATLGSRVIRDLGGQNSFTARNEYILGWLASNCGGNGSLYSGTAAQNADAMATAPYFGQSSVPAAWTAQTDGGLTYFFTELNSGGILPQSNVTGNCGNGAGKTCDSGGNTTFTVATGLSLPSTPSNGTCIGITFNAANGASATLAADGGNAYSLTDQYGNTLGAGAISSSEDTVFCFTNATSAGSVTAAWRQSVFGQSGGWIAGEINSAWAANASTAASYGLTLDAYESGQNFVSGNDATYENWFYAAMRDGRMGTAYSTYYSDLRAYSSTGQLNVFSNIGPFSRFGEWGILENIEQTNSPRYSASVLFTNFLLKRDILPGHRNDNTPMWLDAVG